jgi:hypothetical protein
VAVLGNRYRRRPTILLHRQAPRLETVDRAGMASPARTSSRRNTGTTSEAPEPPTPQGIPLTESPTQPTNPIGDIEMTKSQRPLPAYAEKLWTRLQSNFLDTYKTLAEILETEAWKPTYATFTDAYTDRMANITFAPEMLPHIAYRMFAEGATPDQVTDAVKHVGPQAARRLKEQRDDGVPADQATTTRVREHRRNLPGPWKWLRLKVNNDVHREWMAIARRHHTTVAAVALRAAKAAFEELGRE